MRNNDIVAFVTAYAIAFVPLEIFILYTMYVAFTGNFNNNISLVLAVILFIQIIWLLTCKLIGYFSLTPKRNRSLGDFLKNCWK